MTKQEQEYLDTTLITIRLLGYKIHQFGGDTAIYKKRIYISNNIEVIYALNLYHEITNISNILRDDATILIESYDIILLCNTLLKKLEDV